VTFTVGASLPELVRRIELADMVAYAGATWDWHRLHYDTGYVSALGLPGPVVDGQQLGALLAEQVQDALGPPAQITAMEFRFRSMVYAGETVRCVAQVAAVDGRDLRIAQQILVADRVAVDSADTTVRMRT
jgi:acyl dehydratase